MNNALTNDPMLALTEKLEAALALQLSLPDAEADRLGMTVISDLYGALWTETPVTTTTEGAAGALRAMVGFNDMEASDLAVINSVLAFLTKAPEPEPSDPYLAMLKEYRGHEAAHKAASGLTDEEADTLFSWAVALLYFALIENPPAIATQRGAIEALRQTMDEKWISEGSFEHSALTAALAYFDASAASSLKRGDL